MKWFDNLLIWFGVKAEPKLEIERIEIKPSPNKVVTHEVIPTPDIVAVSDEVKAINRKVVHTPLSKVDVVRKTRSRKVPVKPGK